MGRRKTTVTTMNQKMLDSGDFKYSGQLAMNEWIWTKTGLGISLGGKDLADYFIEYHQNSLPKKFDKLYRWAEKPNRYYYGLPTSTIINDPDEQYLKAAEEYLKDLHGDIEIHTSHIEEIDFYYTTWLRLVNDYGYDSHTNELTVLSSQHGYPCYLKDGYLITTQRTYDEFIDIGLDNSTLPFNHGQIPFIDRFPDSDREQTEAIIGTVDSFMVLYTYESEELPPPTFPPVTNGGYVEPIKTIHDYSLVLDLSDVNPEPVEGQMIPSDADSLFVTYAKEDKYYWYIYKLGSGLLQIDNALSGSEVLGQYYPRVYIKHQGIEVYQHTDTDRKKATIKGCKILGLQAKDVTKSMATSIGDEYGNVHSIYMHMGVKVNLANDDSILSEYCYRYFERLIEHFPQVDTNTIASGAIRVSDNASWQEYAWDRITKQEHTGVISNKHRPLKPKEYCLKVKETIHSGKKRLFRKRKRSFTYEHIFYYQVSDDKYISVNVANLRATNYVNGYASSFNGVDEHLALPIDRSLIFDLTKKEREYLFHHSLLINLLHVKVTKKKWYQTSLFQAIIFVIGVVISVIAPGAGQAGYMAIAKATAVAIVKGIVLTLAVQVAIKIAVKLGLAPEIVAAIAMIASIVAMAYGGGGDFDFSKVLTAPNIMKALNTSFEWYQKMLVVQIADIQKQMQSVSLEYLNKAERLKETQKLLDTKVFELNHELLRSNYTPTVDLFDTVEMFYSRHNNFNVVEASHGLITNFVDGSLTLRKGLYQPISESIDDVLLIQ